MAQVLMIVGVGVFFIIVYGAVMVGGHLLEEPQRAEPNPEPAPVTQVDAELRPREVRA